jgi:hypothetical protein
MKRFEFDAVIKKNSNMDACFVEFPYDVKKEFGTAGQVKVVATFDGYEYRSSLVKMSNPCHFIGLTKEIRKKINKQASDSVHVVIIKDEEPRVVEIPEDFSKLLDENHKAKNFFMGLCYTNQKEYVSWLTSSKKLETRLKRIKEALIMLSNQVKHP